MPYPETEEFFMEYIQCQNCGKVIQVVDDLETTGSKGMDCPYCKCPVELKKTPPPGQDPKDFV
jgi:DNA-directed RNA polymerase subunit RPC12/RpoP